jgi:predicted nucleic acid-binding protein
MKAIIDTNVIIYDYIEDSEHHKEAEAILDSLDKWVIPVIVIHELAWFLKGMKLEGKLNDIMAYIQHKKTEITCDCGSNVNRAIEIIGKEKLPLSNHKDMMILSHAILENHPIATFDKKLSKIAKKYGVAVISRFT